MTWDPYAEFESAVLSNGLTVHVAQWPNRPWQVMGFLIHSGASQDAVGREGTAHFVEHLVSSNAKISVNDLCDLFEERGGSVHLGATGYFDTSYSFFAPADHTFLGKALDVFGHMLLAASLEKDIKNQRTIILNEFSRRYPDEFSYELDKREQRALHEGSWLARFVRPLGDPDSINQITQEDLQRYYDGHYTPANMSIVCVGALSLNQILALLHDSSFSVLKAGARTPLPERLAQVTLPTERRHVVHTSKFVARPSNTAGYRSVAKIPATVPDEHMYLVRKMLSTVLYEEVREKRSWSYAVGSSMANFGHLYEFAIDCKSFLLSAVSEFEALVEDCINRLPQNRSLFNKVKHQTLVRGGMIDISAQNVCRVAMEELARYHRIMTFREVSEKVEQVHIDDIGNILPMLAEERRWTRITVP